MTHNQAETLVQTLTDRIASYKKTVKHEHVGTVVEVGDGVARVEGLSRVGSAEMLDFGNGVLGVALNLGIQTVDAILLGDFTKIKEGDTVKATGKILSVPVGEGLIGRVVSALGEAKDGGAPIASSSIFPVEKIAPRVIERKSVQTPLQTGLVAIDSMIPIGRGQRELIIGDRQTGKTAVAIDAIINQKVTQTSDRPVICIYVAIGQKESKIAGIVAKLTEHGAMEYTTIVLSGASDPASLLYIAPYSGTALAEYFLDKGEDVLIVYDDLSKHAVAYREISLLLRRPPGREAYPGDVFYLHSRLLERACKLNKEHGGGSITALPIIETQSGDVSAYVPTNVISITDGQIYLEPDLFYKGNRPAVNAGLSVSRVGSAAQIKAMKKVAGKMRLEAAQYRELAAFAQFSSDLDQTTRAKLERGKRLTEIFKQDRYSPLLVASQVLIFYALINGFLDSVEVDKIREVEMGLHEYTKTNGKEILDAIAKTGELNEENENKLRDLIGDFKNILI